MDSKKTISFNVKVILVFGFFVAAYTFIEYKIQRAQQLELIQEEFGKDAIVLDIENSEHKAVIDLVEQPLLRYTLEVEDHKTNKKKIIYATLDHHGNKVVETLEK
ncbi:hypothetical protein [Bacillus toyonensis]|uniref:hypothetical protein n=1 Tax=Bacillus toyonensis TaxID=155322 RepID=UPI002E1E70FB|nr:hypothetical protein [Bacillus toyonensis]